MNDHKDVSPPDIWSTWLMHTRHGGDSAAAQVMLEETECFADRVLSAVDVKPGMTLLDVGTGDGLVAFRAIGRVGPTLKVILTDISKPLLTHTQNIAFVKGFESQCVFHECPADKLTSVGDSSVDIIVTRAVLAYVSDKAAAFSEFFRVLKPGGVISLCEPIMRDEALGIYMMKKLVEEDSLASKDRFLEMQCRIMAAQYPSTLEAISQNPTTNFTERDLIHFARGAGFSDVHMELHIDSKPTRQTNWETFLGSSPHPMAPTVTQIVTEHLSENEREYFQEKFRPIVEAGSSISTTRNAYLTARRAT
ncbi:methyltransferase domain-containing protein [Duganella sp. FT135W]|uniref:Methyltransferase domain-containing protein n=1 Tax=Duganella flavida TaxID=2692175 RepID=A0A6L8KBI5_9BURK|nr:class I SAM-dependent methyltransferase [Duganella flavida]MYM23222.1 methyltransferase domain-containing protein [Duganella flavida]